MTKVVPRGPEIQAVWRRWEPRFIAAGVDSNLITRLKDSISVWEEWCEEWSRVAEEIEEYAETALKRDRRLTAGQWYSLASLMYHFGSMYYITDMRQFHQGSRHAVDASAKAAPLRAPPAEPVTPSPW